MSEEAKRLTRWILGHTQPRPYCLDLDHPAMEDIAWAADYIARVERERDEARAQVNAMSIYHEGDAVRDAEAAERIAALEAENAALRADAKRWGVVWDQMIGCPRCNEGHSRRAELLADARRYVADGHSPEKVANMMGISVETVRDAIKGEQP